MSLQQIREDQLEARKSRDKLKATLLTTLIGEAQMVGKNAGNRDTTDAEVVQVVKKFIKNIDESLEYYSGETKEEKLSEKKLLEIYLPRQLTEEQLTTIIFDIFNKLNITELKQMGLVMKELKTNYEGQFDGRLASTIVKDCFV